MLLQWTLVEEDQKQDKSFIDLLKIPGCLLLFVHIVIVFITCSTRAFGSSIFLGYEVNKSLFTKLSIVIAANVLWIQVYSDKKQMSCHFFI